MLWAAGVGRDEWQVDIGLHDGRELDFSFFGCFLQSLQRHSILSQVNTLVLFEFFTKPVDDSLVKIVTAKMSIAGSGLDLEGAFADVQNGNIKCPAAEVIDCDDFILLLIQTIGQCGRGRFVDDSDDI